MERTHSEFTTCGGDRRSRASTGSVSFNPNSEAGRDGALRRPRAVPGAERAAAWENPCAICSARSARTGTAQRAVPTISAKCSTSEFGLNVAFWFHKRFVVRRNHYAANRRRQRSSISMNKSISGPVTLRFGRVRMLFVPAGRSSSPSSRSAISSRRFRNSGVGREKP
jgi:hypothetical protein